MRRSPAVLSTLAAMLLAAPTASAWTNATELTAPSGNGTVLGVALGMNASGQASALWGYASDYKSPSYAIDASTHTVGQNTLIGEPAWTDRGFISSPASAVLPGPSSNQEPSMAIGVGPTGTATAAWTTYTLGHRQVSAASAGADAVWGAPRVLSSPPAQCTNTVVDPSVPQLSVNAQGAGHIAWFDTCHNNISPTPLFTQAFNASGLATNALTAEKDALSTQSGTSVSAPIVEAFDRDTATLGFLHDNTPNQAAIGPAFDQLTTSVSDQRVTGQQYAAHSTTAQGVHVAALPAGGQIVAWIDGGVHVSINGGPDTVITGTASQYVLPVAFSLASGADGTAVLAWRDFHTDTIWGAVRSPDGAVGAPSPGNFGPAHALSVNDGDPGNVRTAVSANGVGYAVWNRDTGAFNGVEGSIVDPLDPNRSPGTPWQFQPVADTLISGGFASNLVQGGNALAPAIAVDANGDADVIAPVEITRNDNSTSNNARFSIAMVENRSTRTPAADPNATPQPTPVAPASGGSTTTPAGGGSPAQIGPTPAPKPSLVISGFQLSRIYFAPGKTEGTKVSGAHEETLLGRKPMLALRVGTQINFTLSQAAKVKVRITVDGCFDTSLSKKAPRGTKHCSTKTAITGDPLVTFTVQGKKGANSVRFSDKLLPKKTKLVVGTVYDVAVLGTDPGTGIEVQPTGAPYFRANVDGPLG